VRISLLLERFELFGAVEQIPLDRIEIALENLFFGDQDVGAFPEPLLKLQKSGAKAPLGVVSGDCVADFFTRREADSFTASLFVEEDRGPQMLFGRSVVEVSELSGGLQDLEIF